MNDIFSRAAKLALSALLAAAFAACGGGDDGTLNDQVAADEARVQSDKRDELRCAPRRACFSVSSTVIGWNGLSPFVLANNGTELLEITSFEESYVFPSRYKNGAVYNVTVATQPPGQVCSVSNGKGTIKRANVTNIQVNCESIPYTIGGTVTGLPAGESVTLRLNNDSPPLAVSANGGFTFALPMGTGNNYDVAIEVHPSSTLCTASGAQGVVETSNVTTVSIVCGGNTLLAYVASFGWPVLYLIGEQGVPTLTFTRPSSPTNGPASNFVVHPNGRFMYQTAAVQFTPRQVPQVYAYVADQHTNTVASVPASPFALIADLNSSQVPAENGLAIHPSGRFLYALIAGGAVHTLVTMAVDSATGALTKAGDLPVDGDTSKIVFNEAGTLAFVEQFSGQLRTYRVNGATGLLESVTQPGGNSTNVGALADHPSQRWIATISPDLTSNVISIHAIDAAGVITTPPTSTFSLSNADGPVTALRDLAFARSGNSLYVSNSNAGGGLWALNFNSATGALSFAFGPYAMPNAHHIDVSGRLLMACEKGQAGFPQNISFFAIDAVTGALNKTGSAAPGLGNAPFECAFQ